MKYLKVKWVHNFEEMPVLLYSELADDRSELRKIEVFPNGDYGYACADKSKGTTRLSVVSIPPDDEIAEDPQFVILPITKDEFDELWAKATTEL